MLYIVPCSLAEANEFLTNKHNFCRIIKSRVRMSVVCGIIATERSLSECSFLL